MALRKDDLTHLSLFTGIGGLDLATFAKLIPTPTTGAGAITA